MNFETLKETVITWAANVGIKVIVAVIILIIAFKIINAVTNTLKKNLEEKSKLDVTIARTLSHLIKIALQILVLVCLIGYLGIETSGISAVIASLGVCVGLAVNGTLSNLAGGVMILLTRPFKIGDYISAQGTEGTVENILICNTIVITNDNKTVYLPNSSVSSGNIINFSEKPTRRVDLDFSVAGNDPALVRGVLLDICDYEPRILKDPAPFARISDFGAGNGTKMTLRAWCNTADYWDVYFNLLDAAQEEFEKRGIVVPFSQMDVHLDQK